MFHEFTFYAYADSRASSRPFPIKKWWVWRTLCRERFGSGLRLIVNVVTQQPSYIGAKLLATMNKRFLSNI